MRLAVAGQVHRFPDVAWTHRSFDQPASNKLAPQAGIVASLGPRLVPVTFAEAEGWTLVIGPWCDPCNTDRSDEVLRLCADLSSRYGLAQAYYFGTQNDGSGCSSGEL